jgi:ribosomal protein S18 acetylase RimI-like enzyme
VERLTTKDAPALQALVEACGDYYQLVYGQPAPKSEAELLMAELPRGKTLADKFMFGIFERTQLTGVVDLVRDFRRVREWYLGLLLLEPATRQRGRGTMVLEEVLSWLRGEGADSLRLAVAEQNQRALRFWQRHGFRLDHKSEPRQLGARLTVLLELGREL